MFLCKKWAESFVSAVFFDVTQLHQDEYVRTTKQWPTKFGGEREKERHKKHVGEWEQGIYRDRQRVLWEWNWIRYYVTHHLMRNLGVFTTNLSLCEWYQWQMEGVSFSFIHAIVLFFFVADTCETLHWSMLLGMTVRFSLLIDRGSNVALMLSRNIWRW